MPALQQSHADSPHDAALAESPMLFDFIEVAQPDIDPSGRIFIPSRAGTPEPSSPRSRPVSLKSPSERSSPPLYEPYPTPSASPARKRVRPSGNKRSMNAFLIYRRDFPSRYPHIDALEKHQGPKSSIIGAMWRAEPLDVKEYFFRLQAAADDEFRRAHGTSDAPRADPVKTMMRRERARQRRTRDEKLAPRSELIVKLWMEKKSVSEFIQAVHEYDEQSKSVPKPETKMKIVMTGSPLSNHTNTPMDGDVPLPSTPPLQIQTTFMSCADTPALTAHPSTPAESPVVRTPSPFPEPLDMTPMVAIPEHSEEYATMDEAYAAFGPKQFGQPFDFGYFNALLDLLPGGLELTQPQPQLPPMPSGPDADAFMAQLFPPSSSSATFSAPVPMWNGVDGDFGVARDSYTTFPSEIASADVVTGWVAYADGSFDFEHAKGVYSFGNEEDLVETLEDFGTLVEPVDNLVDCYVEMSSFPL